MLTKILCGSAAVLLLAGPVSALTMTPTSDLRQTSASASTVQDLDSESDFPSPDFSSFVSESSAFASDLGIETVFLDAGLNGFGAVASANARQNSQIGALSITGGGTANAEGSEGFDVFLTSDAGRTGGVFFADANSLLDVFFSIDASAAFDLQGFLSAGIELKDAGTLGGETNEAHMLLINVDTNATAFEANISNDSLNVNESGVIGPGNYRFRVGATASVASDEVFNQVTDGGGFPAFGYSTAASFDANLVLTATEEPIPEPVTATLAGLGLGALALRVTRRRHRA